MVFLPLLLIILVALCLLLVVAFFFMGVFKQPPLPPYKDYEKQEFLLSPAELEFFNVLLLSVSKEHYVFAKVRIGDLVRVNGLITDSAQWWKKFGPIAKKHVDFVVASRSPIRPLVAIELDDKSHQQQSRQSRDSLVDRVMAAAGLPLLHVPYSRHGYMIREVRDQLNGVLNREKAPHSPSSVFNPAS